MLRVCVFCCLVLVAGIAGVAGCGAQPGPVPSDMALVQATSAPATESSPALDRKIIYEADITLQVRDFSAAETAISVRVRELGGYLADVTLHHGTAAQRSGRWVVRIPVARFDLFLAGISQLGTVESRSQTAQDVTEEYVDLEARIANKQRLEERVLALLADPQGAISDVIEVERELARVREEVERMEGRRRYLANRTELTTVTVMVREQQDDPPPETPALLARMLQAWNASLLALRSVAERMLVAAAAALPWIAAVSIILAPVVWYALRASRRR